MKFANYFLSRKHVQSLKNAAAVLSVIKTLTTNKVIINNMHINILINVTEVISQHSHINSQKLFYLLISVSI